MKLTKKTTVRKLLQYVGTEIGRELHPNLWSLILLEDYNKEKDNWIIPDTRFPNEAQAVKNRNGILIRVNRLTAKQIDEASTHFRDDVETINEHPSETALDDWDDWDYIIDNNGTLEDLLQKVKQICKKENIL